jgi:hypothetical protein
MVDGVPGMQGIGRRINTGGAGRRQQSGLAMFNIGPLTE